MKISLSKIALATAVSTVVMVNTASASTMMARIIGGADAASNTYPWMVSIQSKSDSQHFCGGSLIGDKYVLTAAHCIEDANADSVQVVVSEFDLEQESLVEQKISVKNIYMHQSYGDDNDIAILELTTPSDKSPVQLADAALNDGLQVGAKLTVMGWGNQSTEGEDFPNILQEVQVPLADHGLCKTNYAGIDMTITENMLCAGLTAGGKDSCQGDSGGPLVYQKDSNWFQTGVVSFGEGCAQEDYFGVYTKVSNYGDWVAQVKAGEVPVHQPGETGGGDGTDGGTDGGTEEGGDGFPEFEIEELAFGLPEFVGFLAPGHDFLVEESIFLFNENESPVSIQGLSLDNDQRFSILENTCEAATLNQEDECEIVLGFTSSDSEVHEANLNIATSDTENSTIDIALFGIALDFLELDDEFDGMEGVENEEWYFDGDESWTGDVENEEFDLSCDAVAENADALLMTEIEGPGILEFDMDLSGDVTENTLSFMVDGEVIMTQSSERSAKQHSVELSEGKHQVSWVYKKAKVNESSAKATISKLAFKSSSNGVTKVANAQNSGGAGSSDGLLLGLILLLGFGLRSRNK